MLSFGFPCIISALFLTVSYKVLSCKKKHVCAIWTKDSSHCWISSVPWIIVFHSEYELSWLTSWNSKHSEVEYFHRKDMMIPGHSKIVPLLEEGVRGLVGQMATTIEMFDCSNANIIFVALKYPRWHSFRSGISQLGVIFLIGDSKRVT